jgi:hypothetical protein
MYGETGDGCEINTLIVGRHMVLTNFYQKTYRTIKNPSTFPDLKYAI